MQGQITVEYLLVSLVGLVLISFSIIALSHIKEAGTDSYEIILFRESADSLAKSADTVCALGNYNSRSIYIDREIDVESGVTNGRYYMVIADADSGEEIAKETLCLVDGKNGIKGKTGVINKNGEIYIDN